MSQIVYSQRNTPTQTQGTVEPIKIQANTHGVPRSGVGMTPRAHISPATTNQPASPELIPQVQQTSLEATKSPSPAEDPLISSKFAALARKEKALRQKYAEIASKEQELVKYREEAQKAAQYRERLKSHPLDVLNEEGITYDQLVQRAANPPSQEMLNLQYQVKALEESLKQQTESAQKNAQTQREQAVKQINMDVKELITSNPAYETVKDMGAEEAVTQLITVTYDEDGILLTTDQAAKQVNEYLVGEINRLNGIPSVKKLLSPTPPAEVQQQQVAVSATPQTGMKTLSHSMAPSSEAPARTWAEKKARIVAKYSKKG